MFLKILVYKEKSEYNKVTSQIQRVSATISV